MAARARAAVAIASTRKCAHFAPKRRSNPAPVPHPDSALCPLSAAPRMEQPIYRVIVPPLTFDANEPAPPPDPDPADILLVREAEPLSQPVFDGRVEPTLEAAN